MARQRMKFTNRKSLDTILREMPLAVKDQAHKDLHQGADDILLTQRVLAPVVNGDLKASLRKKEVSGRYKLAVQISAGGAAAPYARRVEFTPGSAFFWPGYRSNKRRVKGRITRGVNKATKAVIAANKKG